MEIRPLAPGDAEAAATIARRCLFEVNARDYGASAIATIATEFSAPQLVERSGRREILVLEDEGAVAAMIMIDGNGVYDLFVDPDAHGRGLGRVMMDHAEGLMAARGHSTCELNASITAVGFYTRLGYESLGPQTHPGGIVTVTMVKSLPPRP